MHTTLPEVIHNKTGTIKKSLFHLKTSQNTSIVGLPDMQQHGSVERKRLRQISKKSDEWFDESAPEDMDTIHRSCAFNLSDILKQIEKIELKFNINDKNLHTTLSRYAKQILQVKESVGFYDIKSSRAMRDVIAQTTNSIKAMITSEKQRDRQHQREELMQQRENDDITSRPQSSAFSEKVPVLKPHLSLATISISEYNENLKLTKFILDKTLDVLNDKYPLIMTKVEQLLIIFEKYLLSFNSISAFDKLNLLKEASSSTSKKRNAKFYLETVYKYEQKRKDIAKFIRKILKNLKSLADKFDNPQSSGVSLSILAKESQELAVRCDVTSLPVLLIIPEYNFQLRRCVDALNDWMRHDKSFIDFIHNDLKELEKQRSTSQALLLETTQAFTQMDYKARLMRQELDKRESELHGWYEKKENDLMWEEEELQDRLFSKQLQKEVLEKEIGKMKKTPEMYFDYRASIDRLTSDLKAIDDELPRLIKSVNVCKHKMDSIKEKKKKYAELRLMVNKLEHETEALNERKNQFEIEFDKLDTCFGILKEIYLYKKSSETLRKIYHNMPLKELTGAKQLRRHRTQFNSSKISIDTSMNSSFSLNTTKDKIDDKLDQAIQITSKLIESEWTKLYFVLPFLPQRGNETIQRDVDKISELLSRGASNKEQALIALQKWRRLHTQCKLDDLLVALQVINRKDIKDKIEKKFQFDLNEKTRKSKEENSDDEEYHRDPHKRELDTLNKKISSFLDKVKSGLIPFKKTYQYVSIGTLINEIDKDRGSRIKV